MRTISVSPTALGDDLDGSVVDGLESLRQRIKQALLFRLGSWFLDTRRGLPEVTGTRMTAALAASVITGYIRDEGGDEVTNVTNVDAQLNAATRSLSYSARVHTVYGDLDVTETVT